MHEGIDTLAIPLHRDEDHLFGVQKSLELLLRDLNMEERGRNGGGTIHAGEKEEWEMLKHC